MFMRVVNLVNHQMAIFQDAGGKEPSSLPSAAYPNLQSTRMLRRGGACYGAMLRRGHQQSSMFPGLVTLLRRAQPRGPSRDFADCPRFWTLDCGPLGPGWYGLGSPLPPSNVILP